MDKLIVTGGGGYLGYVVVKTLLAKGYRSITVIALPNEKLSHYQDLDVAIEYGNILDRTFLDRVITQDSIVFHLAGIVDIGSAKNDIIYQVNVEGCKNVVDACIQNHVKKFIYTSSVHVIDPLEGQQLMSEPHVFDWEHLVGDYAKSKALATHYVDTKAQTEELNAVIVYPSGIIGPYDFAVSHFGQLILDYINRRLSAYIKGGYNFVDVRDVAEGVVLAYEKGVSKEGYLLSGEYISLKDIFKTLNKILMRKKMPNLLALWFVKLMMPFAELHYLIRRKKPIFSAYSLYTVNSNCNFDNSKAKTYLGFRPRPIKESIEDMVEWFFENIPERIKPKVYKAYYMRKSLSTNQKPI